jgi:hypothetical protein
MAGRLSGESAPWRRGSGRDPTPRAAHPRIPPRPTASGGRNAVLVLPPAPASQPLPRCLGCAVGLAEIDDAVDDPNASVSGWGCGAPTYAFRPVAIDFEPTAAAGEQELIDRRCQCAQLAAPIGRCRRQKLPERTATVPPGGRRYAGGDLPLFAPGLGCARLARRCGLPGPWSSARPMRAPG